MELLKVTVETVDWFMGEFGFFDLIIRKDVRVEVDWGNGYRKIIDGSGDRQRFECDYKHRFSIQKYEVSISSDEDNAIIAYYTTPQNSDRLLSQKKLLN